MLAQDLVELVGVLLGPQVGDGEQPQQRLAGVDGGHVAGPTGDGRADCGVGHRCASAGMHAAPAGDAAAYGRLVAGATTLATGGFTFPAAMFRAPAAPGLPVTLR